MLYIYFTRKPVNIQDLYFPRRKDKILRLARSGRGLGQRPHFSNLRAYNERSRCPAGKPLAFPASGASRQRRRMHGSRSRSTFPFQMFPSIRLRIYERFVGGMVEGRIPLPGREKGSTFANRCKWVHLMLNGVFFYHRHPCIWQFLPACSCIGQRDRKIACVIICPQGDGILAASKSRKSEKKG